VSLELSMIVRNGETSLARCLESVHGLVENIVIGDTGSTDATPEIARRHGAEVIKVPWENDFSRARNAILKYARADWVLFLDADEMLGSDAKRTIPPLLSAEDVQGYEVWIWSYVPTLTYRLWDRPAKPNSNRLAAARPYPAYIEHKNVRLFRRRPDILFEKRVHEGVADRMTRLGLKIAAASFVVHHFGMVEDDAQTRGRKNELYQSLGHEKIREQPNDALAHFELGMGELEHFHNPAGALPCFERVIELNPKAQLAWIFAGICMVRLGKLEEGLAKLQRAEQLGSHSGVLSEAQGDAYYHLKNFREARRCFLEAQEYGACSSTIESKLGVCEVRLGLTDQGLRRIEHAIEREPGVGELYDILTATALWLGNLKLAAESAERRLSIVKPTPEGFLQAAGIYAQHLDWQRAEHILRRGLGQFPSARVLHQAITGTTAAPNVPCWAAGVTLLTSALTVRAELARPGALASVTCASPSASGPATSSWTGNCRPVLLSGGIWFQSTSSTVYIVSGSFGCTSMATVLGPRRSRPVTAKANRV
jgi:tetratricopeptide (TPR) repeat protein